MLKKICGVITENIWRWWIWLPAISQISVMFIFENVVGVTTAQHNKIYAEIPMTILIEALTPFGFNTLRNISIKIFGYPRNETERNFVWLSIFYSLIKIPIFVYTYILT